MDIEWQPCFSYDLNLTNLPCLTSVWPRDTADCLVCVICNSKILEISHPNGQNWNQGRGLSSPWLK